MLGKLMKYEIRATARTFLPLYGTVLVLGLINKLFNAFGVFDRGLAFPVELTALLALLLYSFVICAIFVMTLLVTIQRYYKNLLGDEGYLMFTLPVKPWQHIAVKMTVAAMWFIVSVFVTILSLLVLNFYPQLLSDMFRGFALLIQDMNEELGFHWPVFALETAVLCFAFLISGILMIYASMSLGHLFQRHRIMLSFASFLGISFLSQLVAGIFFSVLSHIEIPIFETATMAAFHFGMLFLIFWCLLFCAAYFFLSNYVLSKRLNLE